MQWLVDLGDDPAVLQTAEATARREARHLFARQRPTEGKRRMWQATQIRHRWKQLAARDAAITPAPPDQPDHGTAPSVTAQRQRLLDLGVYPSNADRYASLPAATLDRAEALARTIDGDLPRLIIALLRRHCDEGWPIPAPAAPSRPTSAAFDLTAYTGSGRHAAFFAPPDEPDCMPPAWWHDPAAWSQLPNLLQALISDSLLVDGAVQAATTQRAATLQRTYGAEFRTLTGYPLAPMTHMDD